MNTQVGKSVGIALLMAAGLLAVLFAFGVFAPAQVGAIKGTPQPTAKLSKTTLEATGTTLTVTFQLNDDVNSTASEVTVTVPDQIADIVTGFELDDISVKQRGRNVGSVRIDAANAIIIGQPATGTNIVEEDVTTVLTIEGLTLDATAFSGMVSIEQNDNTEMSNAIAIGPSVTAASAVLKDADTTDDLGANDAGAAVNLEIKFTTDTEGDTSSDPDSNVVITLPTVYDLDTDGNDPDGLDVASGFEDTGGDVTVSGTRNANTFSVTANAITVWDFDDKKEVTVTIMGLTNPDSSEALKVMFKQGDVPTGATMGIQQTETLYITNDEGLGISPVLDDDGDPMMSILSSVTNGASDVEMNFMFTPLDDVTKDNNIVITLNDGFTFEGDVADDITVWQSVETDDDGDPVLDDDDNEIPVQVDYEVEMDDDGQSIVITLNDDGENPDLDDEDDDTTVPANGGDRVYVRIANLVNLPGVGHQTLVSIKQGNYATVSHMETILGTEISTTVAGANVRVRITTRASATIPPGDDIVVQLKSFVVPATIAENQVIIDGAENIGGISTNDAYDGNPSAVSISKTTVNLSIPTVRSGSGMDIEVGIPADTIYTITFKLGAGLKNPNVKQGSRTATAGGEATAADSTEVTSKVTAGKGSASRGDVVEFKVVGLKTGSATIYLLKGMCVDALQEAQGCVDHTGTDVLDDDDVQVSEAADWAPEEDDFRIGGDLQADGSVAVERRVTSLLFEADEDGNGPRELVGKALVGTNIIYSVDGTGVLSDAHGRLAINPTVELGTESIKQGGLLELEISDWYYGSITQVEVGGVLVNEMWRNGEAVAYQSQPVGGDGETDFILVMPPGVRLGEQQLKLTGSETEELAPSGVVDSYTTKIEVDPLDLTITSSSTSDDGMPEVVVNQEFTISGRGFTKEDNAHIASVKFGDLVLRETTAGICVACSSGDRLEPDTAGNFSATFRLEPRFGAAQLKVGEYRAEVKDSEGRIGQVDVTVPEPVVEVTPAESRRGTTVTVVGTKFPASPELAVEISYGLAGSERTIGAATPDSSGNWRATFTVPTTAVIGEDHIVLAAPIEEAFSHFKGKGLHRLPGQDLVVKPDRVAAGGRMDLEGHNMPLFTLVRVEISGITVSGDGFETDGVGSFVKTGVLVPQLQPGIHTVTAYVQTQGDRDVEVRESVEVADIVTRPTDEVFEALINAGQLTVVWKYDNTSGMWASYDPSAPAELNDLNEVSTGDIVWIQITENVSFQGKSLKAGWQLISLE